MHRIAIALIDTCIYKEQKVQLAGLNIRARIGGVWVGGRQVRKSPCRETFSMCVEEDSSSFLTRTLLALQRKSALFTSETRTVFRSESAKYYIFVQLSKEMWMFDDDGSASLPNSVPSLFRIQWIHD